MARLIFHIDVNSAFLSWEAARRVSLGEEDIRLIPSAIGDDRDKRTGVILAKSIPAKKFGIKTGEPVRVPQGYQLSHRIGHSARQGYSYAYSDLKTIAGHKLHHKIFGYK